MSKHPREALEMNFYDRYELVELTRDGSVKTFAARQKPSGHGVSVHLLTGGAQSHAGLMEELTKLPEAARLELLETGEHQGTPYVVTPVWLRAESFPEWVAAAGAVHAQDQFAKAGTWRIPTTEFGRKSAPKGPEPGEFTRMFQAQPSATPPVPEPEPAPPNPEPEPVEPQPGTPVGQQGPSIFTSMFETERAQKHETDPGRGGEFTRMFATAEPAPVDPDATAELEVPLELLGGAKTTSADQEPESRQADTGTGEFTRMFQAHQPLEPREVRPPQPVPVESPKTQGGEFTRMFQAHQPLEARESQLSQPVPAAPSSPAPAGPVLDQPGEFTRMFQTPPPAGPAEARPEGAPAAQQGEFTRMFQSPSPVPMGEAPVPPPPPRSAQPQGPGEFTKFFQAPPPSTPAAHPAYNRPFGAPQQPAYPLPPQGSEFTRMFGDPPAGQQQAAPPPVSPPPSAGEYTRMFASPVPPSAASIPPVPQQPPPAAPVQAGPGEYTRMFTAPPPQSAIVQPAAQPSPSTPAQARRPAAKKSSYLPVFIALGVLLLIAVIAIVVLVLRK